MRNSNQKKKINKNSTQKKSVKFKVITLSGTDDDTCPLCLEVMILDKKTSQLSTCKHLFHTECLHELLAHNTANRINIICPECRKQFTLENIVPYTEELAKKDSSAFDERKTLSRLSASERASLVREQEVYAQYIRDTREYDIIEDYVRRFAIYGKTIGAEFFKVINCDFNAYTTFTTSRCDFLRRTMIERGPYSNAQLLQIQIRTISLYDRSNWDRTSTDDSYYENNYKRQLTTFLERLTHRMKEEEKS